MKQQEPNRLFVIKKPIFISSNFYLKRIKRKFKVKKAGFSGTLDPFAKGCLITAFGQYTKLFRFLKKVPKTYRATLWLGTTSLSGDIENVTSIEESSKLNVEDIKNELEKLDLTVYPNPATGDFTTITVVEGTESLTILNSLGQVVTTINNPGTIEKLDVSNLNRGIYFVQALRGEATMTKKFVVK